MAVAVSLSKVTRSFGKKSCLYRLRSISSCLSHGFAFSNLRLITCIVFPSSKIRLNSLIQVSTVPEIEFLTESSTALHALSSWID